MNNLSEQIQEMHRYFYSRKTYSLDFRITQLKNLKKSIIEHEQDIVQALYKDFKKPTFETYTTEIYTVIAEINYFLKHMKQWVSPKRCGGVFPLVGSTMKVIPEPYGVCAIFSPFNYPFQLAITPLIGALAAGNCAIIKPSEYTPHTNKLLKKMIREVFPSYYVRVVEGDKTVAEKLLTEPLDYVFFTGSTHTAKMVMAKASERLIPVTLELGGKSPVIVDHDADLVLAAKRIVWGKFLNAGQTCVAPDYVLVHENCVDKLLNYIGFTLQHFYKDKKQLARIINEEHYVRLLQLIDEDKVYFGGHFDTEDLYIEPTVLYPVSRGDHCMQDEIFGPILPIIPFKKLDYAVRFVQSYPKPLACYLFGKDQKRLQYLLKHLSFGGGCINDTLMHVTSNEAPFGGVGYSGMGNYHGYYSFKTFSHDKSILMSPSKEIALRYPPYDHKIKLIKKWIR